ncbi:hypothetical protein ACOMHN_024149 [Nucella lapillus]
MPTTCPTVLLPGLNPACPSATTRGNRVRGETGCGENEGPDAHHLPDSASPRPEPRLPLGNNVGKQGAGGNGVRGETGCGGERGAGRNGVQGETGCGYRGGG